MQIHTVFDLLGWSSGAVVGAWVRRRYLRAGTPSGFKISQHPGYVIAVALGAGVGALLAGGFNMSLAGLPPLGHSIAGAIAGGIVGAEVYKLAFNIKGSTGLVFVAPLAMGIFVGRWGCFFSGLPDYTYGTPTALPWGVDFGDGIPRHPVQLYESFAMLGFLVWFVWSLHCAVRSVDHHPLVLRCGFPLMVGFYAFQRFLWEFLKPYAKVWGPFDMFHFLCLALFGYSLWMLWGERRRHEQAHRGEVTRA
ncbi:MAG TPA: prolipoprotein diacylglyceryl transferase family protein [Dongiaceae bacterium]